MILENLFFFFWILENLNSHIETNAVGLYSTPHTYQSTQWITDLNVKPESIKLQKETTEHLCDTSLNNNFLDKTPPAQTTKAQKQKSAGRLHQTKKLLHRPPPQNKLTVWKDNLQNWRKYFQTIYLIKIFTQNIQGLLQLGSKKTTWSKMGNKHEWTLLQMQQINGQQVHENIYTVSIRAMQTGHFFFFF